MKSFKRRMAIAAGAVAAAGVGAWLYERLDPNTYARFKTMFGPARVYQVEDDAGRAVRLLEVGDIVQSGTYVDDDLRYELAFEYLKRYNAMFDPAGAGLADWEVRPIHTVLVLGCGGYDYPEYLIAHHPEVSVVAVEVDPAITDIARRYFHLDRCIEEFETEQNGRLIMVCADARAFLDQAAQEGCTWDAIVNDTFDAGSPVLSLTTLEAAHTIRACLNPGGVYLTNVVSALEGVHGRFLRQQVTTLGGAFDAVGVLTCDPDSLTEPDNVIVVARA